MGIFKRERIVHFHAAWLDGEGATFYVRLRRDGTGTIDWCRLDEGLTGLTDDALAEIAYNELAEALGMPADTHFDTAGQEGFFGGAQPGFDWSPPLPRRS